MNFGQEIRRLRDLEGLTQTVVAKSMGVGKAYLSNVEGGVSSPFTLKRLGAWSSALGYATAPTRVVLLSIAERDKTISVEKLCEMLHIEDVEDPYWNMR